MGFSHSYRWLHWAFRLGPARDNSRMVGRPSNLCAWEDSDEPRLHKGNFVKRSVEKEPHEGVETVG